MYNEEKNVDELYHRLTKILNKIQQSYEIICVDDGSLDSTLEKLEKIHELDSRVKIIKLKGNFGQTSALKAGIDYASGVTIILMDSDLQHDPEDIPKFLEMIQQGYDIVSGWRKVRKDEFFTKRLPSLVANWLMSKLSGVKLHDFGTTFKAYRKDVIKNIDLYGEFHRFIPVLAKDMNVSIAEIPIRNIQRIHGKSKYNLGRTYTVFFDLIRINFLSKYLSRPLQFFGTFGILVALMGLCIAGYLVFMKYFHGLGLMTYRPPLFLLSILLIIIGIQFLTLGLLGEIIINIYYRSKDLRIYYIDKILD